MSKPGKTNFFLRAIIASLSLVVMLYGGMILFHANHTVLIQRDDLLIRQVGPSCFTSPICVELPKASMPANFLTATILALITAALCLALPRSPQVFNRKPNNKSPPINAMVTV